MRVLGCMVVKNEASRYLDAVLSWHIPYLDKIFIFDDRSSDDSAVVAVQFTPYVQVRAESECSFMTHEGRFRQTAWDYFERTLQPEPGDWVLALDADEFLVGARGGVIRSEIEAAQAQGAIGIVLPIPEVFAVMRSPTGDLIEPKVRIDGFWGGIQAPRLFAWQPGGKFNDLTMACGATPNYVERGLLYRSQALELMHYGYADPADVQAKYLRYSQNTYGHSSAHIASIPAPPALKEANYEPWVWRGRRPL
jgi:hypothetical protein